MNSSDMAYLYQQITLGKPQDKCFFLKLFFGDQCSDVDTLFHIYHMTSCDMTLCQGGKGCRPFLQMSSEQQPNSIFCVKYARENNLLVVVCKFVYFLLLLLSCFLILFFCLFVYFFVFLVVISFLFFFFCLFLFQDISPNNYVIM